MKRQKSASHLDFVRSLPCLICGDNTSTEAAHIRFADRRAAKRQTGMGEKPDDIFSIPLCGLHHRAQHLLSEREFWNGVGIDPIFIALALNRVAGQHELGEQIIQVAHER